MTISDEILEAIDRAVEKQLTHARAVRYATVVTASPLTVRFKGDTVTVPAHAVDGLTPVVDKTVVLLRVGTALWAIAQR